MEEGPETPGVESAESREKNRHPKANATSFGPNNNANPKGRPKKGERVEKLELEKAVARAEAAEADAAALREKVENQGAKAELKAALAKVAELEGRLAVYEAAERPDAGSAAVDELLRQCLEEAGRE